MKDTITCPSCNAENPKNRLTCQVCHDPLVIGKWKGGEKSKKVEKETEKGTKVESKVDPKTPAPPVPKVIPPTIPKQSPRDTDLIIVPKAILAKIPKKNVPKVPIKHRAKRKPRAAIELQYFALEDGILIPVAISLKITSMKKKVMKEGARTLLEFWNRNKSLLAK